MSVKRKVTVPVGRLGMNGVSASFRCQRVLDGLLQRHPLALGPGGCKGSVSKRDTRRGQALVILGLERRQPVSPKEFAQCFRRREQPSSTLEIPLATGCR